MVFSSVPAICILGRWTDVDASISHPTPQSLTHPGSWLPPSSSASDEQDGLFDLETVWSFLSHILRLSSLLPSSGQFFVEEIGRLTNCFPNPVSDVSCPSH